MNVLLLCGYVNHITAPVTPIAVMGYNILRVIPPVQVINQLHDNYNYFTDFSWLVTIPLLQLDQQLMVEVH